MATVFLDSASHYTVATGAAQKYQFLSSSPALASPGPSGSGQYISNGYWERQFLSTLTSVTMGCHLYFPSLPPSGSAYTVMMGVATTGGVGFNILIFVGGDGSITAGPGQNFAYPPSGGLTSATGLVSTGTWYYFEVAFAIGASAAVTMRLNGAQIATGNVQTNSVAANCKGIAINNGAGAFRATNIYASSGSTFLVPNGATQLYIAPQLPSGTGQTTQWTPTGSASNWSAVNLNPPNPGSDFVSSGTANQVDLYALPALPVGATSILSVQNFVYDTTVTGTGVVGIGVGNGTTSSFDAGQTTSTTPKYLLRQMDTNPITSAPWALADFTTLQCGQKKVS